VCTLTREYQSNLGTSSIQGKEKKKVVLSLGFCSLKQGKKEGEEKRGVSNSGWSKPLRTDTVRIGEEKEEE